jgi:hypothetical protein
VSYESHKEEKQHMNNTENNSEVHYTCSGGLLNAGETESFEESPEPERMSLRIRLIPRSSRVLEPRGDPLAQVERSRIKPCICLEVKNQQQ